MKRKELRRELRKRGRRAMERELRISELERAIDRVLDAAPVAGTNPDGELGDAILELRRERGIRIDYYIEAWSVPE